MPLSQSRPQEEEKADPVWDNVMQELMHPGSSQRKTISAKDLVGVMKTKKDVFNILSREGKHHLTFYYRLTVLASV